MSLAYILHSLHLSPVYKLDLVIVDSLKLLFIVRPTCHLFLVIFTLYFIIECVKMRRCF